MTAVGTEQASETGAMGFAYVFHTLTFGKFVKDQGEKDCHIFGGVLVWLTIAFFVMVFIAMKAASVFK